MRPIDTNVLGGVARLLGISAPITATQPADFDDALLQQTLDVQRAIRRNGIGMPETGGFALLQVDTTHAGAGAETYQFDVYGATAYPSPTANMVGGWPLSMAQFDAWILGLKFYAVSGSAAFTSATFGFSAMPIPHASGTATQPIAFFDDTVNLGNLGTYLTEVGSGLVSPRFNPIRLPRGSDIEFRTDATGAAQFRGHVLIGVFPSALGQDAVGDG